MKPTIVKKTPAPNAKTGCCLSICSLNSLSTTILYAPMRHEFLLDYNPCQAILPLSDFFYAQVEAFVLHNPEVFLLANASIFQCLFYHDHGLTIFHISVH